MWWWKPLTERELDPGAGSGRKAGGEWCQVLQRERKMEKAAVTTGSGHRRVTETVEPATLVS